MTNRCVIGNRAGQYGAWLSRAGVDVFSASVESQFLISPDYRNEQILLSGYTVIGAGGSATVLYPEVFNFTPVVWFQTGNGSLNRVPFGFPWTGGAQVLVTANCGADRVIFNNNSGYGLGLTYFVISRGFGG